MGEHSGSRRPSAAFGHRLWGGRAKRHRDSDGSSAHAGGTIRDADTPPHAHTRREDPDADPTRRRTDSHDATAAREHAKREPQWRLGLANANADANRDPYFWVADQSRRRQRRRTDRLQHASAAS